MIELVPYVEINGTRTFTDDQIRQIFQRMQSDGTSGIVFSTEKVNSPEEFLVVMKRPSNIPVIAVIKNKVVGVAWLNGLEDNHAFAHFCFLKEAWGSLSHEIGVKLLDYWMGFPKDGGFMFDVIIGRIPSFNQKAIQFVKSIGFIKVGEIPDIERDPTGDRVSALILYYSRREHGEERRRATI